MSEPIDLIILAGGAGKRLGGLDKGWLEVDGQPAIRLLSRRFLQSGDHLIISANRNQARYAALGATVVSDEAPDLGPLAGLLAASQTCRHPRQLVLPCDMPWLPAELRTDLLAASSPECISVLHDGERLQPLCLALDARHWRQHLSDWLATGQRSVHGWLSALPTRPVSIRTASTRAFTNINEPGDLPADTAR